MNNYNPIRMKLSFKTNSDNGEDITIWQWRLMIVLLSTMYSQDEWRKDLHCY